MGNTVMIPIVGGGELEFELYDNGSAEIVFFVLSDRIPMLMNVGSTACPLQHIGE